MTKTDDLKPNPRDLLQLFMAMCDACDSDDALRQHHVTRLPSDTIHVSDPHGRWEWHVSLGIDFSSIRVTTRRIDGLALTRHEHFRRVFDLSELLDAIRYPTTPIAIAVLELARHIERLCAAMPELELLRVRLTTMGTIEVAHATRRMRWIVAPTSDPTSTDMVQWTVALRDQRVAGRSGEARSRRAELQDGNEIVRFIREGLGEATNG